MSNSFVQQAKAKQGQNKKIIDPNKLLQELEGETKVTQSTTTTTQSNQDDKWIDEDDKGGFQFGQNTSQTTKTQKKKLVSTVQTIGWDALNKDKENEKEQEKPKTEPEEHVVTKPQKKIAKMSKPGEVKKQVAEVVLDEEYFPSLGEEINPELAKPKQKPREKKEVVEEKKPAGPVKFLNTKKVDTPEKIAPQSISSQPVTQVSSTATVTEKSSPTPIVHTPATSTIFRNTNPVVSKDVATAEPVKTDDSKYKFGGEKSSSNTSESKPATSTIFRNTNPVVSKDTSTAEPAKVEDSKFKFPSDKPRFMNAKAGSDSKKKEIVKSEEELLREAKDREIEDKLFKEREEARKRAEEAKARKGARKEGEAGETKPEDGTNGTTTEETTQEEKDKQERKGFSNIKRIERAEPAEEKKADDVNGGFSEIKLVKKNPKPKREYENGDKKEKKEHKNKNKPLKVNEPEAVAVKEEDKKEDKKDEKKEEKIVGVHEVIEVTQNVSTEGWGTGLKKIPKKAAA